MQLTLVLPNLLDAPPAALAAADAPALARLLSTAAAPILEPDGPLAIACAHIGIAKQNDWPAAPWLARAAGIDPGSRYWLCAEPVTLDIGRVEVRLAGVVSDLDAADGIALLSSMRAQFASDGIELLESKVPVFHTKVLDIDREWFVRWARRDLYRETHPCHCRLG